MCNCSFHMTHQQSSSIHIRISRGVQLLYCCTSIRLRVLTSGLCSRTKYLVAPVFWLLNLILQRSLMRRRGNPARQRKQEVCRRAWRPLLRGRCRSLSRRARTRTQRPWTRPTASETCHPSCWRRVSPPVRAAPTTTATQKVPSLFNPYAAGG